MLKFDYVIEFSSFDFGILQDDLELFEICYFKQLTIRKCQNLIQFFFFNRSGLSIIGKSVNLTTMTQEYLKFVILNITPPGCH